MVECGGAFHGWSWLGRGRALVNTFMLAKAQKRVNGKRVLFCILREILGSEVGIGFSTGRSKSPKPIMLIQSNLAFVDASPLRLNGWFCPRIASASTTSTLWQLAQLLAGSHTPQSAGGHAGSACKFPSLSAEWTTYTQTRSSI